MESKVFSQEEIQSLIDKIKDLERKLDEYKKGAKLAQQRLEEKARTWGIR